MRYSQALVNAMLKQGKLTVAQAAAIALRTPVTIRNWCAAGKVDSVINGGITFVDRESLKTWLGTKQTEAQ